MKISLEDGNQCKIKNSTLSTRFDVPFSAVTIFFTPSNVVVVSPNDDDDDGNKLEE